MHHLNWVLALLRGTLNEISATWEDGVEQQKIHISGKIALVVCTGIDLGEFMANLEGMRDVYHNKNVLLYIP